MMCLSIFMEDEAQEELSLTQGLKRVVLNGAHSPDSDTEVHMWGADPNI